jgi:hypothetical protein
LDAGIQPRTVTLPFLRLQPTTARLRLAEYYRVSGPGRWKTMQLHSQEFVRRALMHVLPKGFRLALALSRIESLTEVNALPLSRQQHPRVILDGEQRLPHP